jgi:hypothetical protein
MHALSLPGFTAEASLSSARHQYSTLATRHGRNGGRGVAPQLISIGPGLGDHGGEDEPDCILRCQYTCTRYGCFRTNCYWLCF